jgi:eukaryotic-like serine/threonine-protein kinase
VIQQRHPVDALSDSREENFGRYRLLALLGQGGMGRLYLAERRGIEGFVKTVALKRILPHLADSAQLREMFLNEARVAARLEHPNIVTTYELGEIQGQYFISMEYLPGEDLAATLARAQGAERVPVDIAASLAQQAAHGLHYAHEVRDNHGRPVGLVHRDVNPLNIYLTYHGVVKLLDFGVVRKNNNQKSIPGVFKGKYAYCAPEQLEGGQIDRRTDVFCLGIVLWECLTGSHLFDGSTDARIIDAVRSRVIDRPSALRPDVPHALDEIALRALARDPAQRYQNAHDMSEDLERFLMEQKSRPTPKSVGRWLESIFGSERASLKKAISQGGAAEKAIERLAEINAIASSTQANEPGSQPAAGSLSKARPRALWSTSFGTGDTNPGDAAVGAPGTTGPRVVTRISAPMPDIASVAPWAPPKGSSPGKAVEPSAPAAPAAPAADIPQPQRRKGGMVAVVGLAAVAVAVAMVVVASGRLSGGAATGASGQATAGGAAATLEVQSRPLGAHIFVDGSPSGLKTPAILRGLPTARSLEIRLDKPGYEPIAEKTQLEAGQTKTLSLMLREAVGEIRILGAPARATVFVDDVAVDPRKPLSLPAGPHRLRVEVEGSELYSRTVEAKAGEPVAVDVNDRSKQ